MLPLVLSPSASNKRGEADFVRGNNVILLTVSGESLKVNQVRVEHNVV
jgi:hypothetical protein